MNEPATKKPWYRTWWAIAIGAFLAVGIISGGVQAITGGPDRTEAKEESPVAAPREMATPEPAPVTEAPVEDAAPASDLAARTHQEYLNAWGASDLIELAAADGVTKPIYAITEWEDMYDGTIRVYVQETIDKPTAQEMGQNILSLTAQNVPDLETVVIRGADGVDVNVFG
ncbi:hypothetical protein Leucomu_13070 [Leucobacter muris]|uniref:Uncharacterized protein n=1 Tax=Leucobacter muris TaxID=1935379 RepID=A0ABX5QI01_9MICO|nr:hypothetical protein [Leucobacter muris]QAB18717.1 hypothetical protein Leucomu_13070 [Leucobacter muris]